MCVHVCACVCAVGEGKGSAKNKIYTERREIGWGAAQNVEEQANLQGGPPVKGSALGRVTWTEVMRRTMLAAERDRARDN